MHNSPPTSRCEPAAAPQLGHVLRTPAHPHCGRLRKPTPAAAVVFERRTPMATTQTGQGRAHPAVSSGLMTLAARAITRSHTHTHAYTRTHTRTHTHGHTQTHTHTRKHTHAQRKSFARPDRSTATTNGASSFVLLLGSRPKYHQQGRNINCADDTSRAPRLAHACSSTHTKTHQATPGQCGLPAIRRACHWRAAAGDLLSLFFLLLLHCVKGAASCRLVGGSVW